MDFNIISAPAPTQPLSAVASDLKPQAHRVLAYLYRTGSISNREALLDLDMTSATLASRICEIKNAGYTITRERMINPATGKKYTRYVLGA